VSHLFTNGKELATATHFDFSMSNPSIDVHLFSTPGEYDIEWVVEACRPYLENKVDAILAYLPLASLYGEKTLERTERSFHGLARIETINTETMDLPQMESSLRRATVAYIPGGNTFLLNHRLHISHLFPYLRKKLEAGLPLVAFSAGTVLCGPNILTANDLNLVPTPHFEGLNLTPFNFNVHYGDDVQTDNWLIDYQSFHDNPVVLMADGAYIRLHGKAATLVRGEAWLWRAGQDKEHLESGRDISPYLEAQHG
jgi:peptidase E